MSNTIDNELSEALYHYTVKIMKDSNPYITKESISRRVLQECAEILNVDLNCYTNKNIMYIHPSNMDKIDSKWQSLIEQGTKITHDEQNTYKLLKSSDFVNILDVQKFINILANKNEDIFLADLLAMDGFQGLNDHKNYVENLKLGDKGTDHVQIIREMYQKFQMPVKTLYSTLLQIYQNYTLDEELHKIIEKEQLLSVNDADTTQETLIDFYTNAIDTNSLEMKSIALTKLAQLKNQKKKNKSIKRKLKTTVKEKTKKIKKQEDVIKEKKEIEEEEVEEE